MKRLDFDPDVTRRDDAPYWAAALTFAVRKGDRKDISLIKRHLRRLGFDIEMSLRRKAVRHAR